MAVGTGAFSFAHVKYGVNKCLETLLRAHGVAAEREVFSHPGKKEKIHTYEDIKAALNKLLNQTTLYVRTQRFHLTASNNLPHNCLTETSGASKAFSTHFTAAPNRSDMAHPGQLLTHTS